MKQPRVSVVFPEQHDETASALGRAFINDPPFKAILPDVSDPIERARRLTELFRAALTIQRRMGEPVLGVLDSSKVVAAAVIAGTSPMSNASLIAFGLPRMAQVIRAIGWGGVRRSLELTDVLAKNHPPERHIYLNFLGVDPVHQRKHYGRALLTHLRELALEREDLEGVYLETSTEENVAYYSSQDYRTLGEIKPLGVRMWRMFQPKTRP